MDRTNDVLQLRSLKKSLGSRAGKLLQYILYRSLGFEQFNSMYRRLPSCTPAEFSRIVLEEMDVQISLTGESLDEVPREGPLVVVANHPFGLLEGMVLDSLLQSVRQDSTVLAVNWLEQIPEYRERLIFLGPVGNVRRRSTSTKGWRKAIGWLQTGHALAVFPAGRASRFQWSQFSIRDLKWSPHVAAIIRRTGARTVPIFFHGKNSLLFNLTAALAPPLVDFRLIREFNNKRGKKIRATIGRVIEPAELDRYKTDDEAIAFIRRKTESLASE